MADEAKKKKVISIRLPEALEVGGSARNFIALSAEWAKHIGLDIQHAGGLGAYVRWNQHQLRHEALVQCHAITFEPIAQ